MTQSGAVIETIENLGGVATLGQINQHIFEISDCQWATKTPFASIRRIVRHTKGIYRIKPGLYALETHRAELEHNGIVVEDEHNKDSSEVQDFNHSYYQGILVELGNFKHLSTFVPNQDKNRLFLKHRLGEITNVNDIPQFSYEPLVHRSSTIDVIWFHPVKDSVLMPHSFFEVEHSTDIQNSLLKFSDLLDFRVKMYIIADENRRKEFDAKLHYDAFSQLFHPGTGRNPLVDFYSYDSLIKLYEKSLELDSNSLLFS
jgi:hypothetical protein